ncbi:hypothetical protein J6590_054808 [Homalodisca vitripennis]|nr:hypothetical protein J6590_054808 [Homalodisca vitripennis]
MAGSFFDQSTGDSTSLVNAGTALLILHECVTLCVPRRRYIVAKNPCEKCHGDDLSSPTYCAKSARRRSVVAVCYRNF